MNKENFERLNELAVARHTASLNAYGIKRDSWAVRKEALADLWLTASVHLPNEVAEQMIATLIDNIARDAVFYAQREANNAAV